MFSSGPAKGSLARRGLSPLPGMERSQGPRALPSLCTGPKTRTPRVLHCKALAVLTLIGKAVGSAPPCRSTISYRWPAGTASLLQSLTCTPSPERAEQDWICQTLSRIVCRFSPSAISEAGAAVSKSCLLANMSTGTPLSFSSSKSSASSCIIYKGVGWGEDGEKEGKKTFNHQCSSLIRNIFRANARRVCSSET